MPKITNERYKTTRRGHFKTMNSTEFYEKLNTIKARPHLIKPIRYFFLLLFWTGRRPTEILELKRSQINEVTREGKRYLLLDCDTKKGGRPVDLYLDFAKIPLLQDCWAWLSGAPMEFLPFKVIHHHTPTTVTWKKKEQLMERQYPWLPHRMQYWSYELFGVPLYFFRHNRFSVMVISGWSFSDIMIYKGARTEKSVSCYISPTTEKMIGYSEKLE